MKEYLLERNGKYEYHKGGIVPDGAIEVPKGTTKVTFVDGVIIFWKDNKFSFSPDDGDKDFSYDPEDHFTLTEYLDRWDGSKIIWQRPTQPEELPFVESLNDQYAEIEKVRHAHYFKDVSDIDEIDVYEVLHRFGVTDPCLQHIVKKALCAGERGHKDFHTDLKNIADTAQRMLEIHGL